jgi:hypothetical protein
MHTQIKIEVVVHSYGSLEVKGNLHNVTVENKTVGCKEKLYLTRSEAISLRDMLTQYINQTGKHTGQ